MKNFTITKNKFKKEGSKAPDYKMSIKLENGFTEIGGCWLKDAKDGQKYFSCKLNDAYADHVKGVACQGFKLIQEGSEITHNMPPMVDKETVDESQIPF